jgi:hypothetical protein
MSSDYPVVVYGASGYTARLVMEHLRELGVPFVAAGRNRAKIEAALAIVPGIENARYQIAEVEHTVEALTELLTGRQVVCNTVGPFNRFGREMVEAAHRAKVHYFDTTGEQHWVAELMRDWDARFRQIERLIVPSLAYMYGVSEIGARFCLDTPGVDSLELTGIAEAVPTVASAQTILDAVRQPSVYLKNCELVRYPGIETAEISAPSGQVLRASNWGGTSHPIWFSRDGRVRNCKMMVAMWNQELYKKELELERANKVSLQWIPDEALYPMLDAMAIAITPATPPRESRFVHRAVDVCVGTGNVVMVKSTLIATGGYYTTGLMQAYGAMRATREPPRRVGFASPSEAFGHKELMGALESYGYAGLKVERLV